MRRQRVLRRSRLRRASLLVIGLLVGVSPAWAQTPQATPQVGASAQGAVASAIAEAQATTILVPQTQVTYQTVYDVECTQVPVTVNATRYKSELRTEDRKSVV